MFYCDRVVSYAKFLEILEQAEKLGLSITPKAADIPDLTDGADIALTLVEMGHNFHTFDPATGKPPYHHRIEALVLVGDYSRFEVSITDELWQTLPTLQQWWESRPKLDLGSEEDGGEAGVREPRPDNTPDDEAGATIPAETLVG